jgi:hypothetical protein
LTVIITATKAMNATTTATKASSPAVVPLIHCPVS